MSLTDTQKTEIRRFLGLPAMGAPLNMANISGASTLHNYWRIWEPYSWLETRLNALTQDEEVSIFGIEHAAFGTYLVPAMAAVTVVGSSIATGVEFQLKVNGSLLVYITLSGATPTIVAAAMAQLISGDAQVGQLCVANPEGPLIQVYARTPGAVGNGIPVQGFSSDASLTMTIGTMTGQVAYGVTSGGTDPPGPQFTPQGATVPMYGYVPILRLLEADLIGARRSLATDKVDVLTRRPTELAEREALQDYYKRELADRLNVPLYADFAGNRTRGQRRVC